MASTAGQLIAQTRAKNDAHQTSLRRFVTELDQQNALLMTNYLADELRKAKESRDARREILMSLAGCKWTELCLERDDAQMR